MILIQLSAGHTVMKYVMLGLVYCICFSRNFILLPLMLQKYADAVKHFSLVV